MSAREENVTAASFCLTSLKWQSLATEYEYEEGWRISALSSRQLHLEIEDRFLGYNIKCSQVSILLFFFDVSFTNGDFSHPQNQRVFYKKWWGGQSKEGDQILFPFLFFFHVLAQENSITTVPTQADSLTHIPESISAISACEIKRIFLYFIWVVCLLTRLTRSRSSSTVPWSRIFRGMYGWVSKPQANPINKHFTYRATDTGVY